MWPALWKEVDTLLSSQDRGFVYVIWNIFSLFFLLCQALRQMLLI